MSNCNKQNIVKIREEIMLKILILLIIISVNLSIFLSFNLSKIIYSMHERIEWVFLSHREALQSFIYNGYLYMLVIIVQIKEYQNISTIG